WMLAADVGQAAAAEPVGATRLLPGFDQYVVTAPRAAEAVLPAAFRGRVYRPQGWLSPVLFVDGRMAGVRSQERRGDELPGLIEGSVAAVIFAILALGVLAAVDGAARSTGREKARAVASALAERDQERMRSMRAVDLPEYRWTRDVTVGDAVYTVSSEADWVS